MFRSLSLLLFRFVGGSRRYCFQKVEWYHTHIM